MRFVWICALAAVAGCRTAAVPTDGGMADASLAAGDLSVPPNLLGKFAVQLSLDVTLGGGAASGLTIPLIWAIQERPDDSLTADAAWELCDLPLPGLADVPLQYLDPSIAGTTATLSGRSDGIGAVFPRMSFLLGARLSDPVNDPLPTDGKTVCGGDVITGCVIPDPMSNLPGAAIPAAGLDPDVDIVYIVFRLRFAASYVFSIEKAEGSVSDVALESHVLACHLRAGGDCAPSDVAKIEAAHPAIAVDKAVTRSHLQGFYFTCPQLLADPEGSITGIENLADGGMPDLVSSAPPTFGSAIQDDLDARGCATGGCHETFTGPKMMHLDFKPDAAGRMQNYQQVLPWTAGPPTGGRFVNEVPLPPEMRDRWLTWIANGTPY